MFIKCSSLGNSFVLFDWYTSPRGQEALFEQKKISLLCANEQADGALFLYHAQKRPIIKMVNADGSDGQICLNGARCVAQHLYKNHGFPDRFSIAMGKKIIKNLIENNGKSITQYIEKGTLGENKTVEIHKNIFEGHVVNVGNPHFIIFQKQTLDWLKTHGHLLENHYEFPNKTNVEFVWQTAPFAYNVLIHERGCGITPACSSGAAAITWLLYNLSKIKNNDKVKLCMPGGSLTTWVTTEEEIALRV